MTVLTLDSYIIDSLMADLVGHDRQPSAFLIYLLLWRLTSGTGGSKVQIPLQDLAERSGLSKRAVQQAIARLAKRGLIDVRRDSVTAVAMYTVLRPWRRHA